MIPEKHYQFKNKRQETSIKIRKKQRQEKFNKKRNIYGSVMLKIEEQDLVLNQHPQNTNANININTNENKTNPEKIHDQIIDTRQQLHLERIISRKYELSGISQLIEKMIIPFHSVHGKPQLIIDKHEGIIGIRKLLIQHPQHQQQILNQSLIRQLPILLSTQQYPQLQYQATLILINITYQQPQYLAIFFSTLSQFQQQQTNTIFNIIINKLLIESPYYQIKQQAIGIIGNLACQSLQYRDRIIQNNGIQALIKIIKYNENNKQGQIQYSAWALSNLIRGQPLPELQKIKDAIIIIMDLLGKNIIKDISILGDCCQGLSKNINCSFYYVEQMLNTGALNTIIKNLSHRASAVITPSVQIISKISAGSSNQVSKLLKIPGFLDSIAALLKNTKSGIRTQTCWIITNLTTTQKHINIVLKNKQLVQRLIYLMKSATPNVRSSVCHIMGSLATNGDPDIIHQFFNNINIIQLFLQCLQQNDKNLIKSVFLNLLDILEFGEQCLKDDQQVNRYYHELNRNDFVRVLKSFENQEDEELVSIAEQFMVKFYQSEI